MKWSFFFAVVKLITTALIHTISTKNFCLLATFIYSIPLCYQDWNIYCIKEVYISTLMIREKWIPLLQACLFGSIGVREIDKANAFHLTFYKMANSSVKALHFTRVGGGSFVIHSLSIVFCKEIIFTTRTRDLSITKE